MTLVASELLRLADLKRIRAARLRRSTTTKEQGAFTEYSPMHTMVALAFLRAPCIPRPRTISTTWYRVPGMKSPRTFTRQPPRPPAQPLLQTS